MKEMCGNNLHKTERKKERNMTHILSNTLHLWKKRTSTAFFFFFCFMSIFYCLAEIFFSFFFFKFHNEKEICLINISLSLDLFFGEGNQLSISLGRSRWDKKVFFARKFWILKHTVHVWIQPCWDFSWCHSKALNVQWTALKWGNTERTHNTGGYLLISLMATSVSRKTRACTFLTQFCVLFVFLHCPKWVVSSCAPPCGS